MKKYYQKFASCLIVLSLLLSLTGCFSKDSATVQKEFDEFLEGLPARFISENDMNLEFLFYHPENYGFEQSLLELPYSDLEDYRESYQETQDLLKELDEFSYKKLTEDQQLTYDILKDYLTRHQLDEKFYYLDNSYLGSFIGFQAQLPLLLNEYTFEQENDLLSYFHILETAPEVFKKYGDMEKERLDQGVGMSQDILDKVIEQCQNFADDEPFLIETINQKIDAVDFYNDQQKADAKAKNEKLLKNSFVKAYDDLGKQLASYQGYSQAAGLANLPNGKEYYEYLIRSNTGIDDSVEDIQKYLEKKLSQSITSMTSLAMKNPELFESFDFDKLKYGTFHSFEDNIDYLAQQMAKDYPAIGAVNYEVTIVPDSMKDNFSPAAYLKGKIDAQESDMNQIWVNGQYKETLFPTLAHEGFPGHMYQDNYFKRLNLPTIRYLIDYNGYSEGWATYIENKSYLYADVSDEDAVMLELYNLNNQATQCIIGLFDIGIHYEGWTYDEYIKQASQYFDLDEETLKEQYDLIIETPANYLYYYLNGMKYTDLYNDTQKKLGDQFSSQEFHQVLLETGPSSLTILEQQIDQYIESKK